MAGACRIQCVSGSLSRLAFSTNREPTKTHFQCKFSLSFHRTTSFRPSNHACVLSTDLHSDRSDKVDRDELGRLLKVLFSSYPPPQLCRIHRFVRRNLISIFRPQLSSCPSLFPIVSRLSSLPLLSAARPTVPNSGSHSPCPTTSRKERSPRLYTQRIVQFTSI